MTRIYLLPLAAAGVAGLALAAPPPVSDKSVPAAQTGKPAARRLGLHDLWEQVRRRFPGLQAARHAVRAAAYTFEEQKWLAAPSGEISAFLSWAPNIRCKSPGELDFNVNGQPLVSGRNPGSTVGGNEHCLSTTLSGNIAIEGINPYLPTSNALLRIDARLVQPIFTFGKIWAAVDLGRAGLDIAKATEQISQADLALNVLRAYFGLKTLRASYDTVREGREQILTWIKRIDEELERGKGGYTEIDLMRLKVADSQVEMALIDLERSIAGTLRALRYLAQDDAIDIDDEDLSLFAEEGRDLSYYLDVAMVRRLDLKVLEATGRGAAAYRKLRIAELLPDIGAVLSFGYGLAQGVEDGHSNAFMNRLNYVGAGAGFAMRWSLDFGPRAARLQKAQADLEQFKARRAELLGGVAVEVERAFLDLQEAQRRLKSADVAERRARGWLQGIRQNIDVGTAESRDMIDALRAYFDQHLLALRTINDVNIQAATLRRLTGLEIIPPRPAPPAR